MDIFPPERAAFDRLCDKQMLSCRHGNTHGGLYKGTLLWLRTLIDLKGDDYDADDGNVALVIKKATL